MDLSELAVFVGVVREGGVAAASRALGLPKSTVSRNVARLEARLGLRLLARSARRAVPTAEGAQLYERCARIVAEARDALRSVGRSTTEPCGALRLTAPRDFERFLGPILSTYAERYPTVRLDVLLTDRFVDLQSEGFDVAIRGGKLPDADLTVRHLGVVARAFVASPDYLRSHGSPRTAEEIARFACITTGESSAPRDWLAGPDGRALRIEGQIHTTTAPLAREMALRGHGIAMLPRWLVAEDLSAKRLRAVLPRSSPPPADLWIAYPSGRLPPARVRVFVDLLVAQARAAPGWKVDLSDEE